MALEHIDESWINDFIDDFGELVIQDGPNTYGIKEFGFERLVVWKKSIDLVELVFTLTKEFPTEEKYSLISQIRRSAISAPANIAEGTNRKSPKDKIHFLNIAYTSLIELINHLVIAVRLGYLDELNYQNARFQIQTITAMIHGLARSFEKSHSK